METKQPTTPENAPQNAPTAPAEQPCTLVVEEAAEALRSWFTDAPSSPCLDKLIPALIAFQGKAVMPAKTKVNTFQKNKYADLPEVIESNKPLLAECGLGVVDVTRPGYLCTYLVHTSGQWIQCVTRLGAETVTDYQRFGAALSYVRRYQRCGLLGIAPDDGSDDDAARLRPGLMPPHTAAMQTARQQAQTATTNPYNPIQR